MKSNEKLIYTIKLYEEDGEYWTEATSETDNPGVVFSQGTTIADCMFYTTSGIHCNEGYYDIDDEEKE